MRFKKGNSPYKRNYTYSSIHPRRNYGKLTTLLVILLITIFGVLFIYTLFSGKSPFTPPTITYADSLTDQEKTHLQTILDGTAVKSNLTISAQNASTAPKTTDDRTIVYDVELPTTDFYDPRQNVNTSETATDVTFTSIEDLTPAQKVLALDGSYYFDDFSRGGKFRTLTFDGSNSSDVGDIIALVKKELNIPTAENTLSINQTGVTALTRGMIDVLNAKHDDATYFSAKVKDFLSRTDYTHLSNEVSFAEDCNVTRTSTTLCSPPSMLAVIKDVNANLIELTGNHNNDYGATANLSTIDTYKDLGLLTFGGGKNAEEAQTPLEIHSKNTNVTFLGYNNSTSTVANGQGASADYPGANIYDEATAAADITAAKQKGNYVIADVQYFECYAYPETGGEYPACDAPISGQTEFFRHLIDLGADMVVGTQAHQPQTYELYHNKPIYYGLGNLFFDQTYWPGTTRGYILTHYLQNGRLLQTRITPHQYDDTYQTNLMDEETATWFLNRLTSARAEQ